MPYLPEKLSQSSFVTQDDVWGALQAAQSNILSGSPGGAIQNIRSISESSPEERRKLSDRLGLTGTMFAPLVDVVTHPLVLVGALLLWKYKLPTTESLMAIRSETEQLTKSAIPALQNLSNLDELYRGTKIPADLEHATERYVTQYLKMRDSTMEALQKFEGATGKLPTEEARRRIAAHLDGLDVTHVSEEARRSWSILADNVEKLGFQPGQIEEIQRALQRPIAPLALSAPEQALAKDFKGIFDDAWEGVLKQASEHEESRSLMNLLMGKDAKSLTPTGAKKIEKYWPRISLRPDVETDQAIQKWLDQKYPASLKPTPQGVSPTVAQDRGRLDVRTGALLPDPDDLKVLGVHPLLVEAASRYKNMIAGGRSYSYNAKDVIERYYNAVGRVYSWSLPTAPGVASVGERMAENIKGLYRDGSAVAKSRAQTLRDVYLPMSMGRLTQNQLNWAAGFAATKEGAVKLLAEGPLGKMLPSDTRQRLTKGLLESRGLAYPEVGQSISNWLYYSTLGLNVSSSVANLAQPILTVAPTTGLKNLAKGYAKVMAGLPALFKIEEKGLTWDQAMRKVFPEFHSQHLELDALARQEFVEALEAGKTSIFRSTGKKVTDAGKSALMSLFSFSETSNRLAAFYASRGRFLDEPTKQMYDAATNAFIPVTKSNVDEMASRWAADNVRRTQFGSGFQERPGATAGWWAPLRQFTTFGMRTPGFFLNEGMRNPGIIGGALLGSGVAIQGLRELGGSDWSSAFLPGVIPSADSDRVLSGLPVVPPIAQIAASGALALGGDSEQLRRALPLLVPGGVAAARVVGSVPGGAGVSRFLGRSYADYDNPTPDGRVAIYSAEGGLKGYQTPHEMIGQALGIKNPTVLREEELLRMAMGNRDRIQKIRRDMMQALYEGDANHYTELAQEWSRAFPREGPSPITKSDIKALHARRDVARMERVLETLPENLRPGYIAMVSTAMGADFPTYLGLSVGLAQAGKTVAEREPYRARPMSATAQRVGESLHGVKLSEKLKAAGLNQPQESDSAFQDIPQPSMFRRQ